MPFSMHFLSIWAILVNVLLPWAFSSCLLITLKAPCYTKHLKVFIICSQLKLVHLVPVRVNKSVYQHWLPGLCRSYARLQHGVLHPRDFQQQVLIVCDFCLHTTVWRAGHSRVSNELERTSKNRDGQKKFLPACYSSISVFTFSPKAQSWL